MSKVMNSLYLGSQLEQDQELGNDIEYQEWTEKLDEQFREQFGQSTETGTSAATQAVPF